MIISNNTTNINKNSLIILISHRYITINTLKMGKKLTIALVGVQLVLFVTGRVLDDLTWYDVGVRN